MADQQVNRIATPLSEIDLAQAFFAEAQNLFGISLTKKQLGIIIAQNNLETGNRKAMFNYNIGNITHVPGDGWDFYISGDQTRNSKGDWVPTKVKFRAYPTLSIGVRDYLNNLKHRGGGIVWKTILDEDPIAFSKALKKTKYYEADEEDTIDPKTGKKKPGYTSSLLAHYNNFTHGHTTSQPTHESDALSRVDNLLNSFLSALSNDTTRTTKKIAYRNLLPNEYLIKIKADSFEDAVEFSRILCLAIDEEMFSDANVYTDKNMVEIEAIIPGPKDLCTQALLQLCAAISETFEEATNKIGGCHVTSTICPSKKSDYQELDIKLAQTCYNLFHLKFIERK